MFKVLDDAEIVRSSMDNGCPCASKAIFSYNHHKKNVDLVFL